MEEKKRRKQEQEGQGDRRRKNGRVELKRENGTE